MESIEKTQNNTRTFTITITTEKGIIKLDSSDVMQFYFIEDILSMSILGKLVFQDNRGILEFGPLIGNETISIIYGEENDIEKVFRIYSVSKVDKLEANDPTGKNAIEIFFVDLMFFQLNFLQFSRSWTDTRISDIIKHISEKMMGVGTWDKFEKSNEVLDYFYMPYWTPNTALKWLLKRGSGVKSSTSGYCFYTSTSGSNLVPIDTLFNQKTMTLSSEDDGVYRFDGPNMFAYNKILNWSMMGIDNSSLRQISGGVRFGFDNNTKTFIKNEYNYSDILSKHTILGNKSLFSDSNITNSLNVLSVEDDSDLIDNIYNDFWLKKYNLQQCLSFTVVGHEKRKCGEIIEVFWPSKLIAESYNKNLHGKYLIKSITHSFSGHNSSSYTQKLVCIKNGYEDSEVIQLVPSTKKNVS